MDQHGELLNTVDCSCRPFSSRPPAPKNDDCPAASSSLILPWPSPGSVGDLGFRSRMLLGLVCEGSLKQADKKSIELFFFPMSDTS